MGKATKIEFTSNREQNVVLINCLEFNLDVFGKMKLGNVKNSKVFKIYIKDVYVISHCNIYQGLEKTMNK